MRVILDTSLLMLIAELGRDLLELVSDKIGEPIEPIVPSVVLRELSALSSKRGKRGMLARVALSIASRFQTLGEDRGEADEAVITLAYSEGLPVLTADQGLLSEFRARGMKAIYVSRNSEVRLFL